MNIRRILIYFYLTSDSWRAMYNKITLKQPVTVEEINKAFADNDVDESDFITILDEEYPEEYRHIEYPPFVIRIVN